MTGESLRDLVQNAKRATRDSGMTITSKCVPPGTVVAVATGDGMPPRFPHERLADYILRLARLGYAASITDIADERAETARQERRVHQFGGNGDGELAGTFDAAGFWHCVRCGAKSYQYDRKTKMFCIKHRELRVYVTTSAAGSGDGVSLDCPKCGARNEVEVP